MTRFVSFEDHNLGELKVITCINLDHVMRVEFVKHGDAIEGGTLIMVNGDRINLRHASVATRVAQWVDGHMELL